MGAKSLVVESLCKRYYLDRRQRRELWALRDISFSLEPGQILGVIGPNGAGKTTLLKILSRITYPTKGRAAGRGRVLPLLEIGAGFQPLLTTRENIYLNAAMRGIAASVVDRKFDEIVQYSEIEEYLDDPLKGAPSGLFIRLAFSMMVALEPDVILADEVLTVCDPEFQDLCMQRIEEAARNGATVLYVSHNMNEVTRLSDSVLWLDRGCQVELGDPQDVVAAYQNSAWSPDTRNMRQVQQPGSEKGSILFVRLETPEGDVLRRVGIEHEAVLKIVFRVERAGSRARCVFDFHTSSDPAFRTVQPEETVLDEPGIYVASVRIPPHLLADTIYTVDATVVLSEGTKQHTLHAGRALSFQVYEMGRGQRRYSNVQGAIGPLLDWEIERESRSVGA